MRSRRDNGLEGQTKVNTKLHLMTGCVSVPFFLHMRALVCKICKDSFICLGIDHCSVIAAVSIGCRAKRGVPGPFGAMQSMYQCEHMYTHQPNRQPGEAINASITAH